MPIRRGSELMAETEGGSMINLKKLYGATAVAVIPMIIHGVPFILQGLLVDEIYPKLATKWTRSYDPVNILVNPSTLFENSISSQGRSLNDSKIQSLWKKPSVDLAIRMDGTQVLSVYVDGCCLSNGRRYSRGGIGVYFGENSLYNLSRQLGDVEAEFQQAAKYSEISFPDAPIATNNRAELAATIACLQQVHKMIVHHGYFGLVDVLHIHSDSEYVVKGIKQYLSKWKKSGNVLWKKVSGGNVANQDLWMILDRLIQGSKAVDLKIEWTAIPREYNMEADKLSKEGAVNDIAAQGELFSFSEIAKSADEIPPWARDVFEGVPRAKESSKDQRKPPIEPRERIIEEAEWRLMGLPHHSFKIAY
ncbi:ribonuclease H-like domain-containing protein [Peziza echinospora]|nr:ribonuclease H-like domain-containing protein [Peziza echinospora]